MACLLLLCRNGRRRLFRRRAARNHSRAQGCSCRFRTTLGEWRGRTSSLDPQTEHFLGLTDYILSDYAKPDGRSVNLYVAYYANQRTGSSPHSPAVCIPGNGWVITDLERTHYASPDRSVSLPLNRVVIGKGSQKQLVYYWFEERGMKIANEYWSKLYLLRDALFENRTDGALVRLTTPIFPGETEADADKRLQEFTRIVVPALAPYLPAAAHRTPPIPQASQSEMIMRPIRVSVVRLATLCLCLGSACPCRLQLARGARAGLLRTRPRSYLEKKDYVKARIELRNAIQRKADLLPAWQALAEIDEHEQNIPALAGTLFARSSSSRPTIFRRTTKLARLYLARQRARPALKLANTAGELDPKNADVMALKAAAFFKLKDIDGATRTAQEALAIDPNSHRRQRHSRRDQVRKAIPTAR